MTDAVIEFAKWVIQESVFDGYDLDGGIVQEMALDLGLLTKTKYDPEKHGEVEYAEPGDDWYVFSNLLTQTALSPAPEAQQEPVATNTYERLLRNEIKLVTDPITNNNLNYLLTQMLDSTHPSEQAVSEAMVEAAAKSLRPDLFTPLHVADLQSDDYAWTHRAAAKADVLHKAREALKAAMETGQ